MRIQNHLQRRKRLRNLQAAKTKKRRKLKTKEETRRKSKTKKRRKVNQVIID